MSRKQQYDPFAPAYLYAYVNPNTGELVRTRISGAMFGRMKEALEGQGVTQHACHVSEDRQWHEASIRRWTF